MSERAVTPDELRALTATPARSKYGSRKTYVAELDRRFDSQHEANEAVGLWRRQRAGEIRDLAFQVPYRIEVDDELICTYVADFVYDERRPEWDTSMGEAWVRVVADAKGFRTPIYRLKAKLMKACLGITVTEL